MKQKLLNKLWLRVGMIVAVMITALAGTAWADEVTFNFPEIASAEGWTNGVAYTSYTITPITVNALGGGNNGKYYTSSNGSWRMYSGGTVSISATDGNTITNVSSNPTCSFTISNGVATFSPSARTDFKSITVTYTPAGGSTPSISAQNVNIAYNATSGSIAYTLSNATGNVSATVTDGDWLTLETITSSEVPFTCSANTGSTARTATVTLSYSGATDKVVTVTQAVNPNLSNIAALTAQSSGSYSVSLTDALVTYVNGTSAYLEDASGAVLLYHCNDNNLGLAVGDKITGTANVTYTVYNGLPEVTAFELATGYTMTSGNTVTPTEVTIAQLESNFTSYLSRYVKIVGATVTSAFSNKNSTIEQSGSSIVMRDQNSSATLTTTQGSTVTVTAHPSIYNSTHQIAVYEQSQIVVAKVNPTITFNNGSVRVGNTLDLSTLFTSNSNGAVTYSITAGDSFATLDGSTLTGTAEGSVTVKAEQDESTSYNAGEATATITVNPALVLSSIAVTTAPTKTTYSENETFDPTGMVVTATYTDNSTEAVTGYTYSPDGALSTSDTEITISYTENGVTKTTTQAITVNEVVDYATLPFEWAGGAKSDLAALTGVTSNGLGSDYSSSTHGVYIVKFDGTGDYIQVKTDSQPGKVTIGVKMIGGGTASSITVQESANGSDFTNVETLSISGSQNEILELETSNAFASTTRYVRLYFNKGANVGVGPITIAKASTDPVINAAASVELTAETTSGEIAYTISNPVGGTSLAAAEKTDVDWISDVTAANDKVTFTTTVNTGSERTATITLTYGSVTKDVTVTQAEHVDINTYTLVSVITSGKHYVIAATTNSTTMAMGGKNASKNYYDAVDASLSGETLSVASNSGAQEFVIYGPDADGYYTIYDPVAGGYLYASSSSSNDLNYQTTNDANGLWEFDFTEETVTAQGTNSRNLLRYNSSSPRFSCYANGQTAVQFYVKDGEATPTENKTLNGSGYATYCSQNALDFTGNSDVTAWVITAANSNTGVITFSQIEGKVPAGTGMLLKGSVGAEVTISSATGAVTAPSPNLLVGTTADFEVENDGDYYGLSGNTFVKVKAGTVPAGKALLPKSVVEGSGVKAFTFVFEEDDPTGISTVNGEGLMVNDPIYNLAGQRISKMQKGINIVNGKKVLK